MLTDAGYPTTPPPRTGPVARPARRRRADRRGADASRAARRRPQGRVPAVTLAARILPRRPAPGCGTRARRDRVDCLAVSLLPSDRVACRLDSALPRPVSRPPSETRAPRRIAARPSIMPRRNHMLVSTPPLCRWRTRQRAAGAGAPRDLRAGRQPTLKISHQFPGATGNEGDFRDRLCKQFASRRREAHQRRAEVRGLPELVADEGEHPVRVAAPRRARPVAGAHLVFRRRGRPRPTSA